jgi:sodium/bile acid cotransporter 7
VKRIQSILKQAGFDGFLGALVLMIVLAYFFPQAGIIEKPISLEKIANIGVSGVFFFYGLKLNRAKLKEGIANWRMHLLIQCTTFLLFPFLILIIKPLFNEEGSGSLWIALFFLSALPSTVSSSVVMVSIAGGNVPGAIFNASISALIGVFITPVWISLCLPAASGTIEFSEIILKLVVQVLLPVVAGALLNRYGGAFAERNKKGLRMFDQSVILLIVYSSFSKSFSLRLFAHLSWAELLLLAAGMLLLFFVVLITVGLLTKVLGFSRQDRITSVFCASKKSLVHGTVMSKVLFAGNPLAGVVLLPLMMYHALQLIASGILAQQFSKSTK